MSVRDYRDDARLIVSATHLLLDAFRGALFAATSVAPERVVNNNSCDTRLVDRIAAPCRLLALVLNVDVDPGALAESALTEFRRRTLLLLQEGRGESYLADRRHYIFAITSGCLDSLVLAATAAHAATAEKGEKK